MERTDDKKGSHLKAGGARKSSFLPDNNYCNMYKHTDVLCVFLCKNCLDYDRSFIHFG